MNEHTYFRYLILTALLWCSGALPGLDLAQAETGNSGALVRSIEFDGRERTYRAHVPDTIPSGTIPVVIFLHGGGGNGGIVERTSGFSELADREGFIAVYPDGTGRLPNRLTWDAANCCGYAYDQQIDDVGFISVLIDRLIAEFDVDPSRVYVTGHSNGAMMAYRLGCELAGKVAAIAPAGGALNTNSCSPSRPLPVLIVHGEDDQNVPVAGGRSPGVGVPSQDDRVDQPLSFAVDTWVNIDRCDSTPGVEERGGATVTSYGGCAGAVEVERVLIHGWNHRWPSAENGAPLDATTLIWNFVSQFSLSNP